MQSVAMAFIGIIYSINCSVFRYLLEVKETFSLHKNRTSSLIVEYHTYRFKVMQGVPNLNLLFLLIHLLSLRYLVS